MKDFSLLSRVEQQAFPGAKVSYAEPPSTVNTDVVLMTTAVVGWIAGVFAPGAEGNDLCIVYFYGEEDNIRSSELFVQSLRNLGPSVVSFDYRGYGASHGEPSETNFYADAKLIMDWLAEQHPKLRPVVCGKSLGSAVATHIATTHAVNGLILLSPITNMIDVVKHIFPPDEVIIEDAIPFRFDCLSRIADVKCPIFIAHRDRDDPDSPSMSGMLEKAAVAPVTCVDMGMVHNDDLAAPDRELLLITLSEFLASL
ncbi:MAG: lysophospholipase [Gammaproteobacteria bacterium]|nr:lysophospholipase [Gammaproteobacteria bacterium]